MKKGELRELYQMMFPEYPDIVTVKELREMLGISRKLAYKLIDYTDTVGLEFCSANTKDRRK